MVRQAVVAGLASSGCRVSDLGVVPTPTVQLLVRQLGAQGGIAITASHNPPEWNALKFVGGDGLFLSAARGRELLDIYHQGDYAKAKGADQRTPERVADAVERHVRAVRRGRRRRCRRDAVSGWWWTRAAAPPRSRRRGSSRRSAPRSSAIHATADGRFPRPAEPVAENLGALGRGRPRATAPTSASPRTWTATASRSWTRRAARSARS